MWATFFELLTLMFSKVNCERPFWSSMDSANLLCIITIWGAFWVSVKKKKKRRCSFVPFQLLRYKCAHPYRETPPSCQPCFESLSLLGESWEGSAVVVCILGLVRCLACDARCFLCQHPVSPQSLLWPPQRQTSAFLFCNSLWTWKSKKKKIKIAHPWDLPNRNNIANI